MSGRYVLDTNIIIALFADDTAGKEKFAGAEETFVPSIAIGEILTVREVAEYLKLSRTTIWRWCSEGKLQAFKVGRGWRIHRSETEKIVGRNLGATGRVDDKG